MAVDIFNREAENEDVHLEQCNYEFFKDEDLLSIILTYSENDGLFIVVDINNPVGEEVFPTILNIER